jgi:hypothetical protein
VLPKKKKKKKNQTDIRPGTRSTAGDLDKTPQCTEYCFGCHVFPGIETINPAMRCGRDGCKIDRD